jgi:hypothetical protein
VDHAFTTTAFVLDGYRIVRTLGIELAHADTAIFTHGFE